MEYETGAYCQLPEAVLFRDDVATFGWRSGERDVVTATVNGPAYDDGIRERQLHTDTLSVRISYRV